MKCRYKFIIYSLPIIWYYMGTLDKKDVRKISYSAGLYVSQKYKKYPMWDSYVEPLLIRQFTILDCIGHSFIKGMISDNKDKNCELALDELKNTIKQDFEKE